VFTQVPFEPGKPVPDDGPSRLVLLRPDGSIRVLSAQFYAARDPALSFDAQRLLFAAKRSEQDRWQIYEMRTDSLAVRQLTREPFDCQSPFYHSLYYVITSDRPWHQIGFVARGSLYSARLDGSGVQQITYSPYESMEPALLPDGRIVYAAWQRDRPEPGARDRIALFDVTLAGSDLILYAGDEGAPFKRMPCVTDRLVLFTENERVEPDGAGWLAAVTLRRPLHSYRRLTRPADGLFLSPAPLPDGSVLVARCDPARKQSFGLYQFDPFGGKLAPLYDDPHWHDIQPRAICSMPEPDGHSSVVNPKVNTGGLYCLNVYETDLKERSWMPPRSVRRVRVLEAVVKVDEKGKKRITGRRLLGDVEIEQDGSFNFTIPANTPVQIQLVDKNGLSLRSCSWIWVRNKEPRGCIGCHEDRELAPESYLVQAVTKRSIPLLLPPKRRRTVLFQRDVLPIIRTKCSATACHGGKAPSLDSKEKLSRYVGKAARVSPLIWNLFGRNMAKPWDRAEADAKIKHMPPKEARQLTADELQTFIEWIDFGAQ